MSLVLPSAALALGLGDIHVKSALHEPLAAEIDLVGATDNDLAALTAGIADGETFQRYGLERPVVLSTTTLTVSNDGGDPVISLQSTDAFSEPVLTLLVDVHSRSGEFIREYTILLDPPFFPQPPDNLESKSAAPVASPAATLEEAARVAEPERVAAAPEDDSLRRTYTVAPRDTLERIARLAGARSGSERRRMMIAIFRANQDAFQNSLNRLRSGVTLRLPSEAELSAVSADEADREFASQMRTARASDHRGRALITVAAQPIADAEPVSESREADRAELAQRVRSVEESREQLRQDFARTLAKEPSTRPAPAPSVKPATVITTKRAQIDNTARGLSRGMALATLAGGLVLALLAAAWFHRRQRGPNSALSHSASTASSNATGASDTAPSVELPVDPSASNTLDGDQLGVFNPEDEATTAHLVLTGEVKEPRRFVERRKSPADVLRQALEREPDRSDLRLKLIELYYTAAAQNRRAFVKATRRLAEHQHLVSEEEWSRILKMGRAIAPEDELFAVPRDSKAVA